MQNKETDPHTKIILDRYSDRENIGITHTPTDVLLARYLSKVMNLDELQDKSILELGAGCSQYIPLFLESGCARYIANDIIPERLSVVRSDDPRYEEIAGDFRTVHLKESIDIIFASLTMMFVIPMLDEFAERISNQLRSGGLFLSMDANYLCPLSVYRRFKDRKNNPARLFNPFYYAQVFESHGLEIEKLVPFTAPLPWTTGNWLFGTTFWMRARKL